MYLPFQAIPNKLGLVLFPIYSKMHYGFNYVGSKHLHPSTHTKLRHGTANDTTRQTTRYYT